jgi:hypothetical protein
MALIDEQLYRTKWWYTYGGNNPASQHIWLPKGKNYKLNKIQFFMKRSGTTTDGPQFAMIWLSNGTHSVENQIAESNPVPVLEISTTEHWEEFTFPDAFPNKQRPFLLGGEKYCISADNKGEQSSDTSYTSVAACHGTSDNYHPGQAEWGNIAQSADEICYKLYADETDVECIDKYSETNRNTYGVFNAAGPLAAGQSIQLADGISYKLEAIEFYLGVTTNLPSGSMHARVYAATGTAPNMVKTGNVLAISDSIMKTEIPCLGNAGTASAYRRYRFDFTGDNQITLEGGQKYCLLLWDESGGSGTRYIYVGADNSSPTHAGNFVGECGDVADPNADIIFYLYGTPLPNATTQDATDVSGDSANLHGTIKDAGAKAVSTKGWDYTDDQGNWKWELMV